MNEEHSFDKKPFDPRDYPALLEFLPAYLHQDFAEEYGSASAAVRAFVGEASGDEILQAKEEWKEFREVFRAKPLTEVQTALEGLGCAWLPRSEDELRKIDEILLAAST
jgi:hypothetical protein